MAKLTIEERLKKHSEATESGCVVWTAYRKGGYGWIAVNGRNRFAHRVAYELARGEIPSGMCVCHRCDNPACINVDHLFLGTHEENMRDMSAKGRHHLMKGEANPKAKVTADDVLRIRASVGRTLSELAAEYGMSAQSVWAIRVGKNWRHVGGASNG